TLVTPAKRVSKPAIFVASAAALTRHTPPVDVTASKSPPYTPVRSRYKPLIAPVSPVSVTHGFCTVAPDAFTRAIAPGTPVVVNNSPAGKPPRLIPCPSSRLVAITRSPPSPATFENDALLPSVAIASKLFGWPLG